MRGKTKPGIPLPVEMMMRLAWYRMHLAHRQRRLSHLKNAMNFIEVALIEYGQLNFEQMKRTFQKRKGEP